MSFEYGVVVENRPMTSEPEIYERARFEATLDDVVDVSRRWNRYSPAARRVRRNDIAMTVGSTSAACFVVSVLVSDVPALAGLAFAIPVGLVVLGIYPVIHDRIVASRTRALAREAMRGAETITVEVALTPLGVVLHAGNDTVTVEWPRVTRISDVPEGVEIVAEAAVVMVRARAFASPEERAGFLTRAKELAPAALPPR